MPDRKKIEGIIAQAVADSFFAMQAGETPEQGGYPPVEPNAGDMQLAVDVTTALIAASGGADHIVHVRNRVWTIQHPITERFEDHSLFECRYIDLIQIAWGQGAFDTGYHRVWIEAGVLMWEEVR